MQLTLAAHPHRKHWLLRRDKSTFVDWQRVKVQELSEQVRVACTAALPRFGISAECTVLRNSLCRCCRTMSVLVTDNTLHEVCKTLTARSTVLAARRSPDSRNGWMPMHHLQTRRGGAQVPPGSLPRTMDVIMRNDVVESVRAGDKMVFTGSLVVVPDISAVTAPGERLETRFGAAAPDQLAPDSSCSSPLRAMTG